MVKRYNEVHPDFEYLVNELDKELAGFNGEKDAFYNQFNKLKDIHHMVVAYSENNEPLACGAIKKYDDLSMEVKRMYVIPSYRKQGLASIVLAELEEWAAELGYKKCVLETGKFMPEAVALYQKNGYEVIDNYGQYIGVESSVCLGKSW